MDDSLKRQAPYERFKIRPGGLKKPRNESNRLLGASYYYLLKNLNQKNLGGSFMAGKREYYSSQNCTVKVNYVYNEYKDHFFQEEYAQQWQAHGQYLQRRGSQIEYPSIDKSIFTSLGPEGEAVLIKLIEEKILKENTPDTVQVRGNPERKQLKIQEICGQLFDKIYPLLVQKQGKSGRGFNDTHDNVQIPKLLKSWQKAGDEHLWKIIVSPEKGEDIDLKEHVRELMKIVEQDLGTKLQWVAIDHYNTLHFHAHIVIRGVRDNGDVLRLSRDYFTTGFRSRSRQLLTQKLGIRTTDDILESRQKIIKARHITEIDREIKNKLSNDSFITLNWCTQNGFLYQKNIQIKQRLEYLQTLQLAKPISSAIWRVDPTFIDHLRWVQTQDDIIKSRSKHMAQIIDNHLPMVTNTLPKFGDTIIGRLVGTGLNELDENSRYFIIEGIDGRIHYVKEKNKLVRVRDNHELRAGNIVILKRNKFVHDFKEISFIDTDSYADFESIRSTPEITKIDRHIVEHTVKHGFIPTTTPTSNAVRVEYMKIVQARVNYMQRLGILNNRLELNRYKLEEESRLKRRMDT